MDIRTSQLMVGFLGAEPWSEGMREEIEAKLGILALDIYGLSEVIGPGVSTECPHQAGLHICEDHFLPEIINPATGEVLPDGERGELVFTTLTKEALPIIRYRTGDITALNHESCACGRTLPRVSFLQRSDDLVNLGVVRVSTFELKEKLDDIRRPATVAGWQLRVGRQGYKPILRILIRPSAPVDETEVASDPEAAEAEAEPAAS